MNDELKTKIYKTFFSPRSVDNAEAFVQKVMARVEEPAPFFHWPRFASWFVPLAGLAAILLMIQFQNINIEPSPVTENLLLADQNGLSMKWFFSDDHADTSEELLGINLEEQ